jgi:glycosyltransferase involved in cell wall biosynthesis
MKSIQRIIEEKPTVWTWHDPWPMTGHCIYPMTCNQFNLDCKKCPDLERAFTIGKDFSHQNLLKKSTLWAADFTLHVSTRWFEDLIRGRIGDAPQELVVLPFGLDSKRFSKKNRGAAQTFFGIKPGNLVIGIRAVSEFQKNFRLFKRSLDLISGQSRRKISIITLQNIGMLDEFRDDYQIIELPWTNDPQEIDNFYNALDVFVMPSRYETFGFMSLEAMSYGVPVVGLRGTAIDEICNLERNGFAIAKDSPTELAAVLDNIINKPELIESASAKSRTWVQNSHNLQTFISELASIYTKTYLRFWNKNG